MSPKTFIWIGMFVGTTLGSFIPKLWGASMFSPWSILLSTLFGALGIYFGYKVGKYM